MSLIVCYLATVLSFCSNLNQAIIRQSVSVLGGSIFRAMSHPCESN